ncbi:MAG: tyrosine-type recombinase/integrase [Oscillospiraceae bacterium]|nr:tyrosine-type recombinase/integrase [Oscillospiraceae bacterium]
MNQETRQQLKAIDLSVYNAEITQFEERLKLRNLATSTFTNYLACLKIFLAWCILALSSKPADRISYDDFRAFLRFLNSGDLEPRTINVYIATLKQFRYLIQGEGWNRYEIQFLRYDQTLPKIPSPQQALAIIEGSRVCHLRTHLLVCLLFSTGIRISEACALTYGDLIRDKLLIHIRPGKGRSDRYVPLLVQLLKVFEAYCRETIQACQKAGLAGLNKDSVIFRMDDGITPANTNFLRRDFAKALSNAWSVKEHFTPHSCRHFFALQIYLQKKDLILVKELLGHRFLNATEVYLRLAAAQGLIQDGYTNPLLLCLEQREQHE